jgi:peptidyl-prolyl cis-trans isomerase B (cyclophilin B)
MAQDSENPIVIIETSMGTISAELWADRAPKTVENVLAYVDDEFYDGLIFHRVIPDFMIQGGGMDEGMNQKAVRAPVVNEATAELRNDRGTLAMARTSDVNSATAQFFINLVDNGFLNHQDETAQGFGYCAFGIVTEGQDVVSKIGAVSTGRSGSHDDVPVEPLVIKSIRRA